MPAMPGLPGDSIIEHFEDMTRRASDVQKQVLSSILRHNAHTEYLQLLGLNGRTDPSSFKKCIPIITHSDIHPLIQRIADGDQTPILTSTPIHTLSLSSGTTNGSRKYIPLYKEILEASLYLGRLAAAYRAKAFPLRPDARSLEFVFAGRTFTTRGGVLAGTATTHLFRSEEFKLKQKSTRTFACSPDEVIFGSDCYQSMYCHLLCGLLHWEEIEFISSTFAYGLVEAFRTFEAVWPELCNDLRKGQLNPRIRDAGIKRALSKMLKPMPELADMVAKKCESLDTWHGLIPTLWPNCKYIYAIMTGSMEPYLKKLQHYAGELPLVSADYGATESWIGVNTTPKASPSEVSFTVVPSFAYFEFIPLKRLENHHCGSMCMYLNEDQVPSTTAYEELPPVDLADVEIGQEYEIIMTTYGGFYRYRLGDVVKVTGKYNCSPQLTYVCRKNVMLNIHIDKNTEKDLLIAVNKASKLLRDAEAELVDFTSYADLSTTPGHYVIFWELNKLCVDEGLLQKCASVMDTAFVDPGYAGSRAVGTIGRLELCIVKPGTFRRLLDRYLARNATAISQYKTPRCLPSLESFKALKSHMWRSYFSSEI